MRVADYIVEFLERHSVDHVFMLSGGGIMYLVDALGRSKVKYVCCHHEQAAAIAAQAYAMTKNNMGVCLATTGPGGTNTLTAMGAAYMDSTPVLYLTGQVKRSDFACLRGVRQFGAQENDIVSMAKSVTKYAATVMDASEIKYHMEKAWACAMEGRRGPVLLDIPLDIQNEEINPAALNGYHKNEIESEHEELYAVCNDLVQSLKVAKRPLFLIGHGTIASNAENEIDRIVHAMKVPVVTTWRALSLFDDDDPLFFGSPGLQARRYSNIIVQSADLLVVLGSRLDNMITAFNEPHFAYRAKKYIVDIDSAEINKLVMKDVKPIVCDIKKFLVVLQDELGKEIIDYEKSANSWLSFCRDMKVRYPLLGEKQEKDTDLVDLYKVSMCVSELSRTSDVIVPSSTSRCNTAGHMAFKHKCGQICVSSMGYGSMGFALPSVIGAHFAIQSPEIATEIPRIVMFEGDGSLQLNIQELQTIKHYNINAKMFVFSNAGYAAIATMQDRNFGGFHVGSDAESGVTLPNLEKIAKAYDLSYYRINHNDEIVGIVTAVMHESGPTICEFVGDISYDEIPKCISYLNEDGERVSALLENPFPFLPENEMKEIFERII